MEDPFVIARGGQAGVWAVKALRQKGLRGPVLLLRQEERLHYGRPPRTQKMLAGEAPPDRALRFPAKRYPEWKVRPRLGVRATPLAAHGQLQDRIAVDPRRRYCSGGAIAGAGGLNADRDVRPPKRRVAGGRPVAMPQ